MEIIISHTHLDLDGFASMILAKKLYPEALLVFSGDLSPNVKSLANLYQDYLDIYKASEIDLKKIKKMIVVDTAQKNRIGKFGSLVDKVEVVVYDHHLPAKDNIETDEKYINRSGSNSANILNAIINKNKDTHFEDYEATIALMGIYEDTGNFVFNNTTKLDMEMAAWLVGRGAKISMVSEYVSKNLKQQELDMILELMENGEILEYSDYPVFISTYYSNEYFNGIDILINKIMELEGAEACFIIMGTDDRTSIVGRSKNKDIAVDKVLSLYAEGGHKYAASVNVKGKDIYTIEKEIKEQLEKYVNKGKLAKDIMKSPVKIVDSQSRVKDVHKIMFRFGYSGIPIMDGENLIGLISRRDIDKAINHGFSNAPVRAYMSKNLITADENTPVKELKNIIIENEIGRVPILRDGILVGIVTRTDILRSLYEQKIKRQKGETAKDNEIKERILDRIPQHLLYILKNIEEVSEIRNEKAYLVGGIVRDLILGIDNLDIDIVVEGDGPLFAEKLADILGAMKVVKHDKFRTAVVILADGVKIDVASSRVEYYEYPTSLPTVDYGSIKQDLYRRDFSINAMALEVDYHNFGKIIDYYNGYRDLREGKIRILHNLSFIEDPTRIIRAVRFAARYDFDFDKETRGFMVEAIESGFLDKLSWHRVRNEIIHILKEKNVERALEILFELRVISSIHRNIKVDEKMKNDLKELKKEKEFIKSQGLEIWVLYLLILLENLEKAELDFVFKRFSFGEAFIKKYDYGIKMREEIKEQLRESDKKSRIYTALSPLSDEVVMLMYVANKELRPKIKLYIDKISSIERTVTGKDLIERGYKASPSFKVYLEELYLLELDNDIHNKEELIALWENSRVEENKKEQVKE